jgi:glycosyltransferase involved in cell wall biosynthesis
MKVLFFCWAEEMKVELAHWTNFFEEYNHSFVITPLIKKEDKPNFEETITKLNQVTQNTFFDPIYINSQNASFRNLLNPKTLVKDFFSIFNALNRSKPDVVICYYVTHAYPLALMRRMLNYRLCVVAMGSDVNFENSPAQKIAKEFVYQNCHRIFAVSWKLKRKIESQHHVSVTLAPSSTDTSFFRPLNSKIDLRKKWNIDPEKKVVLAVCRLDKNKAVDILINALKTVGSKDIILLVAGAGPERKALEALAARLSFQESVLFLGYRNRPELLELYNLADIFALSSYVEGLPRVLIEAMSCGCIPVATDVGGVSSVITNGVNGFLVPPGSSEAFSNQIRSILVFPEEKKQQMRSLSRQVIVEKFDSKKVLNDMVKSIGIAETVR